MLIEVISIFEIDFHNIVICENLNKHKDHSR